MTQRRSKLLETPISNVAPTMCLKDMSQNLGSSAPKSIWSLRTDLTNFDMSMVPDLIPEQSEPKNHWKSHFSGFFPKAMVVLNNLIIFFVVVNNFYPIGRKGEEVLAQRPSSIEYNALRAEVFKLRKELVDLQKIQDENAQWREDFKKFISKGILNEKLHLICNVDSKIREAINLYDADKIAMIDYALESSGAFITSTPETKPCKSKAIYNLFQFFDYEPSSNPRAVIQKEIMPGQCYAFEGLKGRIRIKLSKEIAVSSVTLEHAHKSLLVDLRSTPKDFEIYGLFSEDDPHGTKLGEFQYQITGEQLQMFRIEKSGTKTYNFVELRILNNYGHPDYTCVYRFRVHSTHK